MNTTSNVRKQRNKALWHKHCFRGKSNTVIYSERVSVAMVIQHAKSMRRIISSSVACLAVPYCCMKQPSSGSVYQKIKKKII